MNVTEQQIELKIQELTAKALLTFDVESKLKATIGKVKQQNPELRQEVIDVLSTAIRVIAPPIFECGYVSGLADGADWWR